MDNIKISLAIFGNQNSNSGFQPLYWINNPPQQLENIVPPGMDENPYFFMLQILSTHTQYTLIHNRVSSYMSVRPGVLKMAIAIPKGYSIRDGVSPLEVLLDVRQQFINSCMTLRDAHTEAYNYKEKLADADQFTSIINSYELVPSTLPHLPMTGIEDAVMLIDEMAISQLFLAPQHPEFQRFRSVVIANKGNASVYKMQFNGILASALPANNVITPERTNVTRNSLEFSKNSSSFKNSNVAFSETKADNSKDKSAQQKKYLLILLFILLVIGALVFLLKPTSNKKTEKENTTEVVENEEEDEPNNENMDITDETQMQDLEDLTIKTDNNKQEDNTPKSGGGDLEDGGGSKGGGNPKGGSDPKGGDGPKDGDR